MSLIARPASFSATRAGSDGTVDEILHERLEFRARELQRQVLGTRGVRRDVRQVDLGLLAGRQLDLGLLRRFLQALHCKRVLAHVDAALLLELGRDVVDHAAVEVLAAEEGVAVRGQDLELALAVDVSDLDDRDVEGAAAEVIDRDLAVLALLVHAIRESCRGRLIDDAPHVEAGDAASVLGRLALRVVEIRGHSDHGIGDGLAEVILGRLLHLHENARRDFRRRHVLALGLEPGVAVLGAHDLVGLERNVLLDDRVLETAPDQALHRMERVLRIGDRLALGRLANLDLAVLREGDDRRSRAVALAVLDDLGRTALHDCHA